MLTFSTYGSKLSFLLIRNAVKVICPWETHEEMHVVLVAVVFRIQIPYDYKVESIGIDRPRSVGDGGVLLT